MKKILLLSALILSFVSCEEDDSAETPIVDDCPETHIVYDMEGKWVYPSSSNGISNTMYIYENGIIYTYYCISDDCASQYESFEAGDSNAIPRTEEYTFENNVLTIRLGFGHQSVDSIVFKCNGGEAYFEKGPSRLFRLNSGCD